MAKKRNRLEIIRDILKIIGEKRKIKPTPLLHKSNLSPQKFKQYIGELKKKEFIEEKTEEEKKYFILKKKGVEYLEEYRNFSRFIEGFGL